MQSKPATLANPVLFEADRSDANRTGVKTVDHFESSLDIGRDAYRIGSPDAPASAATVAIGLLWLAVYMIAVLYTLTSAHRTLAPIPNIAPANVTVPQ